MPKKTIADFFAMKERGEKITSTAVWFFVSKIVALERITKRF